VDIAATEGVRLAGSLTDLRQRGYLKIGGRNDSIEVFLDGDTPKAVDGRCPHEGVFLHFGKVEYGHIVCAFHGACFELSTGKCRDNEYEDIRAYPTIVDGDDVYVIVDPAS
jgi:nitrite reductase/ring-hydroxylating ferredoxin subunit